MSFCSGAAGEASRFASLRPGKPRRFAYRIYPLPTKVPLALTLATDTDTGTGTGTDTGTVISRSFQVSLLESVQPDERRPIDRPQLRRQAGTVNQRISESRSARRARRNEI